MRRASVPPLPPPEGPRPPAAGPHGLDPTSYHILRLLAEDGRKPIAAIARQVGLTDNAVRYRLRQMRRAGVVRRVSVHVDPGRLGRPAAAVLLLQLAGTADLAALGKGPCVVQVVPTEGDYDATVVLHASSEAELARCVEAVREAPGVVKAVVLRVRPEAELPLSAAACNGH